MSARLPANVERDDLIQVGMLGLADAMTRFDAGQGAQFETFATRRIRGAMLDELRRDDRMSRIERALLRRAAEATRCLGQRLGREPVTREVAAEVGVPLAEYQELLGRVGGPTSLWDDDGDEIFPSADRSTDPLAALCDRRLRTALVEAIARLPERERFVVSGYYERDMLLKDIGAALGVSEARACQLLAQAHRHLRVRLQSH